MVSFDDVLEILLRTCENFPGFGGVERATVVRDIRGHVRIALKVPTGPLDIASLEAVLGTALGSWFARPILGPETSGELSRLRGMVLGEMAPWNGARWTDPATGSPHVPPPGRWHRIERHVSKLDWVGSEKTKPPWPLVRQRPAIVTFYSFKGGVGRTTLLASTAWQLAAEGKRVVAIDLDVEAPGLGALLGADTRRGVLDFLVDHAATASTSLDDLAAPAHELGDLASLVDVIPAGVIDARYFEKLARLDFVGSLLDPEEKRPVRDGLRALLRAVASRAPAPDYILLDSRAGLHDVAGLSLHDLAHVDVLVGRDSDQGYRGLELTVEAIGRRRRFEDLRCVVAQTMAPDDSQSAEYARVTGEYRRRSHDAFLAHVYSNDPDADSDDPTVEDDDAHHFPSVVLFQNRLVTFTSLSSRRQELFADDYKRAKDRIVELCVPEVGQ